MQAFGDFGGSTVRRVMIGAPGKYALGAGDYEFFLYRSKPEEEVTFDLLSSFTVFLLHKEATATVRARDLGIVLDREDHVQAESSPLALAIEGGSADFLVAGVTTPQGPTRGLRITRSGSTYRVTKPWGHELWINGEHPSYSLKQIFLRAPARTSLQYHRLKRETNVLFEGSATYHYRANRAVENDRVSTADLGSVSLAPISVVDVPPQTLHRLQAVSDVLLYEVSTPHLNDVIRVQDDTRRPDGRVQSEHGSLP